MTNNSAWSTQLQLLDINQGADKLQDLIILDARPKAQWQQSHLPGAISLCWEDYTSTDSAGVKYRIIPPAQLAQKLGELGISSDKPLLIYADAETSWGGEGWLAWALSWLGHQGTIYVLDGGINAWVAAQLPVNNLEVKLPPTEYEFTLQPQMSISAQQLASNPDKYTLVDTRNYWIEWLPSHLPGAIHIDWKLFYTGEQRRPLNAEQLKKLLSDNGVTLDKPIVYYCSGGIRSGYTWMVHTLAGLPTSFNYEGGSEEWNLSQQQQK
ncbi:MAG: rhodanese-like domain-containing protein [Desulfuromonas sp.]|nr:rhodanese-like domain-containing protein [Desulfuromonas sp.]